MKTEINLLIFFWHFLTPRLINFVGLNVLVLVYAKYAELYHFYQNPITLSQISKVGKSVLRNVIEILKALLKCHLIKSIDNLLESFNITEISEKSRKRTCKNIWYTLLF